MGSICTWIYVHCEITLGYSEWVIYPLLRLWLLLTENGPFYGLENGKVFGMVHWFPVSARSRKSPVFMIQNIECRFHFCRNTDKYYMLHLKPKTMCTKLAFHKLEPFPLIIYSHYSENGSFNRSFFLCVFFRIKHTHILLSWKSCSKRTQEFQKWLFRKIFFHIWKRKWTLINVESENWQVVCFFYNMYLKKKLQLNLLWPRFFLGY